MPRDRLDESLTRTIVEKALYGKANVEIDISKLAISPSGDVVWKTSLAVPSPASPPEANSGNQIKQDSNDPSSEE